MSREHDVASRTWGHAPKLRSGLRVIVWPCAGGQYAATLLAGPKPVPRHFDRYLVRPNGGRARWVSCTSIVSAIPSSGRLPA